MPISNPIPPGKQAHSDMPALVDTGASRTVLTPEAVEKLGLPLVGYEPLARAGGTEPAPVHVAAIRFPLWNLSTIEVIEVFCCELPSQLVTCLIGRDVLSRWLFTYDGRSGQWSIKEDDVGAWVEPPEGLLT
jgi:predicted aspartyl protease